MLMFGSVDSKIKNHIGIFLLIVFMAFVPMLVSWLASSFGYILGCKINESGTDPCTVAGIPFGNILSGFFAIGWLSIATLPLGVILLLLWIAYTVYVFVLKSK